MISTLFMVDSIAYTILKKSDELEIRNYPELVVASTSNDVGNTAFNLLFNYISGNNKSREKIAMTSPVISKKDYMAFCLPSKYSIDTAPIPINPKVNIELVPKRILAVLRFSGKTNEQRIKQYSQKLRRNIEKEKLQPLGSVILFRYNSPFTPGFLSRNEVAMELIDFDK